MDATVDGISVNVYSGETVFYKAGAAVSLIRRGKEIAAIEEQSLPVGIIRDVCFAKKATKLETEDIVLSIGVRIQDRKQLDEIMNKIGALGNVYEVYR